MAVARSIEQLLCHARVLWQVGFQHARGQIFPDLQEFFHRYLLLRAELMLEDSVNPLVVEATCRQEKLRRTEQLVLGGTVRTLCQRSKDAPHHVGRTCQLADPLQDVVEGGGLFLPQVLGATRFLFQMTLHRWTDGNLIEEERVMAICGIELVIHHVLVASSTQRVSDLLLLPHWEQHVVLHTDHQGRLHGSCEASFQARLAIFTRQLQCEAIHGFRNPQH
mmetsp:Transcript_47879/g.137365  ORF Transcript_47879/g.137365 Transcript_47879/m.137365 type:complete len:221 (+) Transcript_47879:108-770(+)